MIRFKYGMDKQKFKDFLQEVAVIKELKPSTTGVRLDENSGGEVRYGNEWIEVGRHENPTLGFKFVKTKDKMKACELGCGDVVANQVIESKICVTPKPHWRTRCVNCDCFVSPDGKGFIKGGIQIQNAYTRYFRGEAIDFDAPSGPEIKVTEEIEIRAYQRETESKYQVDDSGNIRLRPMTDK